MAGDLAIFVDVEPDGTTAAAEVTANDVRGWVRSGRIAIRLGRYRSVRVVVPWLGAMPNPWRWSAIARWLSRGRAELTDLRGGRRAVTAGSLLRCTGRWARDLFRRAGFLARLEERITALEPQRPPARRPALGSSAPLYLRTDLWYGVTSGGSVGHVAGVVNNLDAFGPPPVSATTDRIATVREDLETHILPPPGRWWDCREVPALATSEAFAAAAQDAMAGRVPAYLYQRYSVQNFTGVLLQQAYGVPLVLEYNGSEIWIARNWGRPLRYERLAERIELTALRAADLVVVVSAPMRDELAARGVDPERVLVNPNGVDPERYRPDVDGTAVREAIGAGERVVIGFIGTFHRWHGAAVLAEAYGRLCHAHPELRERTALLMIGDGPERAETAAICERYGVSAHATFTGRIPQEAGPAHLAACDILASPHVPNEDGTPFFGSPTKLFEYLAMGRAVVASDLDQIGELLEHDRTARLVPPGDPDALAGALAALAGDPDARRRLGTAAREAAVRHHTWRAHTERIVDALRARCEPS